MTAHAFADNVLLVLLVAGALLAASRRGRCWLLHPRPTTEVIRARETFFSCPCGVEWR